MKVGLRNILAVLLAPVIPGVALASANLLDGTLQQGTPAEVEATATDGTTLGAQWRVVNASERLTEDAGATDAKVTTVDGTKKLSFNMPSSDTTAFLAMDVVKADGSARVPLYKDDPDGAARKLYYTNVIFTTKPVGNGQLPNVSLFEKMYASADNREDGVSPFAAKLGLVVAAGVAYENGQEVAAEDYIFITRRRFWTLGAANETTPQLDMCNTGYTVSDFTENNGDITLAVQFKTLSTRGSNGFATTYTCTSAYRVLAYSPVQQDWVSLTKDLGYKWIEDVNDYTFDFSTTNGEWLFFISQNKTETPNEKTELRQVGLSATDGATLTKVELKPMTETVDLDAQTLATASEAFRTLLASAEGAEIYETWVSTSGGNLSTLSTAEYENLMLDLPAGTASELRKLHITGMTIGETSMTLVVEPPAGGDLLKRGGSLKVKRAVSLAELQSAPYESASYTGDGKQVELTLQGVDKPFVQVFFDTATSAN